MKVIWFLLFITLPAQAIDLGKAVCNAVASITVDEFNLIYAQAELKKASLPADVARCEGPLKEMRQQIQDARRASTPKVAGAEPADAPVSAGKPEQPGCFEDPFKDGIALDQWADDGGPTPPDPSDASSPAPDQQISVDTPGHAEDGPSGSSGKRSRDTASSDEPPAIIGCGLDAGTKIHSRLDQVTKKLRRNSVYEIMISDTDDAGKKKSTWEIAKAGDPNRKCVRVITDENGVILGRLAMGNFVNGKYIPARLFGSMLPPDPNPGIRRFATRFYDALTFGPSPYVLSSCSEQVEMGKAFAQFVQRRPDSEEVNVRALRFAGTLGDPTTYLDFEKLSDSALRSLVSGAGDQAGQSGEEVASRKDDGWLALPAFAEGTL